MSSIEQTRKEIMEAYVFLRTNNMTIPSDTLEFMKDSALNSLFIIENKENSFEPRKKAKITHCIKGHDFEIGEIVEILEYFKDDLWLVESVERDSQKWYITEDEADVF